VASWHTPYKKPNGERALACLTLALSRSQSAGLLNREFVGMTEEGLAPKEQQL